jgi:thioredoxin 1
MSEIHLTDDTFDLEVIQSKGVVLVDFWAEWCGPCKMVGPIISQIADEMVGKVKVCKLEVDQNPKKAQEHGIMSIPTMMIFKDGKMVDMFVGQRSKEDIVGRLNKSLEEK